MLIATTSVNEIKACVLGKTYYLLNLSSSVFRIGYFFFYNVYLRVYLVAIFSL